MPQRGRECQCRSRARRCPASETITAAVLLRGGDHRLEQPAVGLLDVGLAGELRAARRADAAPSASRTRSSSPVESTRGPPTAPTCHSIPRRGKAEANSLAEAALEPRDLAAQVVARAPLGGLDRGRYRRPAEGRRCDRLAVFEHFGHSAPRGPVADGRILNPALPSNPRGCRRPATAPPRRRSRAPRRRWIATSIVRVVLRPDARVARGGAEQQRQRALVVGDHQRARRELARAGPRAAPRRRSAGCPAHRRRGRRRRRAAATPDSMIAIVSASSSRLWLTKPPCSHPLQRQLLDRGPLLVGVEPDVAVEDAVGPGDRLVAHVDRLGAGEAVGEDPQPLLDLPRRAAGAALDDRSAQARARETPRSARARPSPARSLAGRSPVLRRAALATRAAAARRRRSAARRRARRCRSSPREQSRRDRRRRPSGRPPTR